MRRKIVIISTAIAFSGLVAGILYLNSLMPIITGYPAKYLCSAVFISNRQASEVEELDLNFSLIRYVRNDVNYTDSSVSSHFLWGKSKAVFRERFGTVLVGGEMDRKLTTRTFPVGHHLQINQDTIPWPMGNVIHDSFTGIDTARLNRIKTGIIDKNRYKGHAFAFLVIHKGIPVMEGYKPGFSQKTRFLSWSMAKSFTNALVGILVKDGLLDPDRKAGIPSWQSDDRKNITLNNLLRMECGLEWNEDYGARSDVTMMLYNHTDYAGFALNQKLLHKPGTAWYYSSGTTNIVNLIMRRCFASDSAYYAFTYSRLFNKTGMPDAIFETDPSGTLVGSSYVYATARDFGRFGLLYLQNGAFNGEQILPEGWVEYTATPTENSKGNYGAFFWHNKGGRHPDSPADMYYCNGHDGQRIFIIPSRELVVVVLGYSPKPDNEMNFNLLLKDILAAF